MNNYLNWDKLLAQSKFLQYLSQDIISDLRSQVSDVSESRVREGDELNAQLIRAQQEANDEREKASIVAQLLNTIQ